MSVAREISTVVCWHSSPVLLPRPGTKVLGYWGAGEYHVAERGWSEGAEWVNSEDGSTLVPPLWWTTLAAPEKEEE